jgi:superfamily II DNA or RNA helicase
LNYEYYDTTNSVNFYNTTPFKKEFNIQDKTFYKEGYQESLANYISSFTPYNNVLLYGALGSGKTCSAISISEGLKETIYNYGRKIVVLTKNKNIQYNFINELVSGCTNNEYVSDANRKLYFSTNPKLAGKREVLKNKIRKMIGKYYTFYTYGAFVNQVLGLTNLQTGNRVVSNETINNFSNSVIIIDEVHNITGNDVYFALKKLLDVSYNYRLVFLTGTPISDNIKEIFELANLLNKNANFPIRQQLLNSKLIQKNDSSIIPPILKGTLFKLTELGHEKLSEALQGRISYRPINEENFPKRMDIGTEIKKNGQFIIKCEMSKFQATSYTEAITLESSNLDIKTILNIKEIEEPLDQQQKLIPTAASSSLFKLSNDSSTFVYPNGTFGKVGFNHYFVRNTKNTYILKNPKESDFLSANGSLKNFSCKIYKMLKYIEKSNGTVFIYSNYVNYGGTSLLKIILQHNGYINTIGKENSFVVFDSGMSLEKRENIRRIFNSPENKNGERIKIIIGSPLMSEGITLKNVRQVHILEPFWNMTRIDQIIGRAIRNYSHLDLPKDQQTVSVFKYAAILNSNKNSSLLSIDLAKYALSEEKDRSNKQVTRLLKEISLDCHNLKPIPEKYNGTAKCDYTTCQIKCKGKQNLKIDKSTYLAGINIFDKEKINWTIEQVKQLFNKQFMWSAIDLRNSIDQKIPKEVLGYVMYILTKEKVLLQDMYERDGYIIPYKIGTESLNSKNSFFVFQPLDKNEDASVFKKFFDFEKIYTKNTLNEFIEQNPLKPLKHTQTQKIPKSIKKIEPLILTKQEENINQKIMKNKIYGTFYDRHNIKDDTFRIIDNRIKTQNEDGRKIITGMSCFSFKKPQLLELANYLKIDPLKLTSTDKDYLCAIIQKHLKQNKLILL